MNSYLALRKANKMRFAMVSETSQKQIRDMVHYLQVVSWDISGVEAIKSDLIDMAIQANKEERNFFSAGGSIILRGGNEEAVCHAKHPQSFLPSHLVFPVQCDRVSAVVFC